MTMGVPVDGTSGKEPSHRNRMEKGSVTTVTLVTIDLQEFSKGPAHLLSEMSEGVTGQEHRERKAVNVRCRSGTQSA